MEPSSAPPSRRRKKLLLLSSALSKNNCKLRLISTLPASNSSGPASARTGRTARQARTRYAGKSVGGLGSTHLSHGPRPLWPRWVHHLRQCVASQCACAGQRHVAGRCACHMRARARAGGGMGGGHAPLPGRREKDDPAATRLPVVNQPNG